MIMENDEFVIPEQYRKMSVTELDAEANKIGKTNFSFEKGETKNLILYCIFTDEEVENDIIALNFHLRNSPFIGPLAIIHEPETN